MRAVTSFGPQASACPCFRTLPSDLGGSRGHGAAGKLSPALCLSNVPGQVEGASEPGRELWPSARVLGGITLAGRRKGSLESGLWPDVPREWPGLLLP